jgi:hypothetical protein
VGGVFRDRYVSVYLDDERVRHAKKRILTPGEMEQVVIKADQLRERAPHTVTVKLEEE